MLKTIEMYMLYVVETGCNGNALNHCDGVKSSSLLVMLVIAIFTVYPIDNYRSQEAYLPCPPIS